MPRLRAPSRTVVAALAAVAVVGVTGGVVAATRTGSSTHHAHQGTAPGVDPSANATIELLGLRHGLLRWDRPARLVVSTGHLSAVTVTSSDGNPVDGVLSADGREWSSTGRLIPRTRYVARAVLSDDAVRTLRFHTTDSSKHLTALLSPGDGDTVGVGSPIVVSFSRPVPDAKRAMVERGLAVSTTPAVVGAWHWMNAQEVHWRPPTYWKSGTRVTVSSDLDKLYFGGGVWGSGKHQTSFRIGHSHISRVDGARHEMYVYDNGHLVKTFPISAGRTQYPTKSGVHITFEKSQVVTMDSATVGIPRNSPDGYYEKVYWDVRISYGGAFVHAAPWSVAEQGIANVSHGCVNISTDNAIWFYNFSLRGDIVDVYNTGAPPDTYDPGMADWNMSWKQWLAGDAAPTAAAKALRPPWPRSVEPPAPGTTTTRKSSPPHHHTSPSPTPSPSASPSPRRATH
ncbi:MAG TPA: Ig-like domain-containing protein [Mycobacteriales bacterium]|nr:Ig-like domain-containing protein [Mycobacteriales bacterium]